MGMVDQPVETAPAVARAARRRRSRRKWRSASTVDAACSAAQK